MLWNNHHCNYVKAVFQGGLSGDSVVENLSGNAGDTGLIPGLGRAPGEGNGNPLRYSCLGNPKDREAWWPTVHGVTKNQR